MVDTAIIGAGPYGLGLAAHLRHRGLEHRIFGPPMRAWRDMSPGMYLKSQNFATSIAAPFPGLSLPDYCRLQGLTTPEPLPIGEFARYGLWVREQLVPHGEEAKVTALARSGDHFALSLETGEQVRARTVVVATGLSQYEHLPGVLRTLPPDRVSHTADHGDFSPFAGQSVVVVGGGQSALQAAALLHEHGAQVKLLVRNRVEWAGVGGRRTLLDRVLAPNSVLGYGKVNWLLQHAPMLVHYLPAAPRLRFTHEHLGPNGAWWLRERVEGQFALHEHCRIRAASIMGGQICLQVWTPEQGEERLLADHLIAGTGYVVDVDRLPFLSRALARQIRRIERAPALSRHFETSVRGLYVVGPASAPSFGPLFRFVAGSAYAVPMVARHLAKLAGQPAEAPPPPADHLPVPAEPAHRRYG